MLRNHRLFLRRLAFAGLLLGVSMQWSICRADTDVVEQQLSLPVTIDGRTEQLDTLIVRPTTGRHFPVALIVNGSSSKPRELHAAGLAHLAHDFAHRGYLAASVVWRGYGDSSGTNHSAAGSCRSPETGHFLDAHVDDLEAALSVLRHRRDVDPDIAIGVGISIGGASMLSLAARPGHPLTAVINISGGVYYIPEPTCAPFQADLVDEMSNFGAAGIPTLWLYAQNDPWFQPELVQRMAEAYRAGGGSADLTMFPPFGTDGHTLFRWEANALTKPAIDPFLRANDLPAMDDERGFAPLLAAMSSEDRDRVQHYFDQPTEKALVIPDGGRGVYWHFADRSIEDARDHALAYCREKTRKECHLVAENGTLLNTWRQAFPLYVDR